MAVTEPTSSSRNPSGGNAIVLKLRRLRRRNWAIATWAIGQLDGFRRGPSADQLEQIQGLLRAWHDELAADCAESRRRRGIRSARLTRRFGSSPALHEARRRQDTTLKGIEKAYNRRERILLQVGDSLAWVALGGRTRVLYALHARGRRHPVPRGPGADAIAHMLQLAHATGEFLVIQNDLTSVLRIGDLTVVRAGGPWRYPLVFEVKVRGPDDGGNVEVGLHSAKGGRPIDEQLLQDFRDRLGFTIAEPSPLDPRGERQVGEIVDRTELMLRIVEHGEAPLASGERTNWAGLEGLLDEAWRSGQAVGPLESGVYILAARALEEDDIETHLDTAVTRIRDEIVTHGHWHTATSEDVFAADSIAALVPPFPLWPTRPDLLARVLTGELFLVGYTRSDLWPTVFARFGLELREDDQGWTVARGERTLRLDPPEVLKLRLGTHFSGFSPQAVAEIIAKELTELTTPTGPGDGGSG